MWTCAACGQGFLTERSRRSHRRKGTPCELRPAEFIDRRATRRRAQEATWGDRTLPFYCGCGRRFPSQVSLGSHRGHQPAGSVCRPVEGYVDQVARELRLARKQRARVRNRRRRRYLRAWRRAHPAYHAAWRAANAERERERRRRWRRENQDKVQEQRRRYQRPSRAVPELPAKHHGHPILELAHELVPDRDRYFDEAEEALVDDLRSEAVVAILEERDPREAIRRFASRERGWRMVTASLYAA